MDDRYLDNGGDDGQAEVYPVPLASVEMPPVRREAEDDLDQQRNGDDGLRDVDEVAHTLAHEGAA